MANNASLARGLIPVPPTETTNDRLDGTPNQRGSSGVPSILPPRGPSIAVRGNYLPKRSIEYITCVLILIVAICYFVVYELTLVCRHHYDELKMNLRPPWAIYRRLGSLGVDSSDMQWYLFIIALPPAAPVLIAFLVLSRRLRRQANSVGTLYTSTTTSLHTQPAPAVLPPPPTGQHAPAHIAVTVAHEVDTQDPTAVAAPSTHTSGKHSHGAYSNSKVFVGKSLTNLHWLHIATGGLIALGLSGPGFLFGVALMLMNYLFIAKMHKVTSFRVRMTVMWVIHIAVLFLNFHANGYKFAWFGLSFLDNLWTPLIQWTVQYNMSVLRMIAFNNDYWEALSYGEERREKALLKHARSCTSCAVIRDQNCSTVLHPEALLCYKCRTECCRPVSEYNLLGYLGYLFYPPLLVAGPMASYNSYISYLHHPQCTVLGAALRRYAVRFFSNAVVLVTMMHYWHIMAMLQTRAVVKEQDITTGTAGEPLTLSFTSTTTVAPLAAPVISKLEFYQQAISLYLTLAFLWAKFNVIWKFFRLFALLDGMDPPEDMPRCFTNTVNIQGFWRDWHASFNLWIVRYMYIPMGGSRRKFLSIFPIFFFIAIWHDIELRLLYWAMFICVFFVPEIVVTTFFSSKKNLFVLRIKKSYCWRILRVLGSQLGMMELILVNLVGFSIGINGTKDGLDALFSKMTPIFCSLTAIFFFCAANIAIQDRDEKAHQEKMLKIKYDLQ